MLLAFQVFLGLLTVCGLAFNAVAWWSARRYLRSLRGKPGDEFAPAVSILKPLKGADEHTYTALRSHCLQQYGSYEILFGVNDENDAAIPVVRQLTADFPTMDLRLIVCKQVFGANRKVSNLIHLLREAKHEYVLVNDGDIRVAEDYLRNVMSCFGNPDTGMATCLYRGEAGATLGSRLEALGIAADFAPGVLTARFMDAGLQFALGSTMAMSRAALDAAGGFEAVVEYLADDYQLGNRIAAAGFKVELAPEVVETSVPAYTFRQFWEHQLRWARTMRISRPKGYRGLALTYALPWAILLVIVAPDHWWSWTLLVAAAAARVAVAIGVGAKILNDRNVLAQLWLLPLRDSLALAIWFWSYAADTVTWRGEKFILVHGKMRPVETPQSQAAESHIDISH